MKVALKNQRLSLRMISHSQVFLHSTIAEVLHVYILYNLIPNRSSDKLMYGRMPITQDYIMPLIAYARSVCRGISESRSAQTSL